MYIPRTMRASCCADYLIRGGGRFCQTNVEYLNTLLLKVSKSIRVWFTYKQGILLFKVSVDILLFRCFTIENKYFAVRVFVHVFLFELFVTVWKISSLYSRETRINRFKSRRKLIEE